METTVALLPVEKSFHLSNGVVLRSFEELLEYSSEMPSEVFSHHVNESKNDFYWWIKEVIQDDSLASSLKRIKRFDTFLKKLNEKK